MVRKKRQTKVQDSGLARSTNIVSGEEMNFHVSHIAKEGTASIFHPFNLCRTTRGKDCSRDRFCWVKRAKGDSGGQEEAEET